MTVMARFELDAGLARQLAWARMSAGALALVAGTWLMLLPGGWVKAFAAASLIFGALWIRGAIRNLREPAVQGWLEVGPDGIERVEGGVREQLRWRELDQIVIDHDRLQLQLHRAGAAPLVIEPRYASIGLDELARRLEAAQAEARARGDAPPSQGARPRHSD